MTDRHEAQRRTEALGWLAGRLAWEQGLRFQDETEKPAAKLPVQRKTRAPKKAAA
ncbi:MAG TPA: hypothetical protein VHE83_11900 [Mycobacteriales bacterium]|nr:hypothetical protein [Mycobacteriales bacterium]